MANKISSLWHKSKWFTRILLTLIVLSFVSTPTLAQTTTTFLPFMLAGNSGTQNICQHVGQAAAMETLFKTESNQQRTTMTCDPILMEVAQARAEDMANRNYFAHINPDGDGPNYLAIEAGYEFPSFYSSARSAVQIESIAAGNADANYTWTAWMGSTTHKNHLLGLNSFFAEQGDYGIGYAYNPNSDYRHYWVVLTGKPATTSQLRQSR